MLCLNAFSIRPSTEVVGESESESESGDIKVDFSTELNKMNDEIRECQSFILYFILFSLILFYFSGKKQVLTHIFLVRCKEKSRIAIYNCRLIRRANFPPSSQARILVGASENRKTVTVIEAILAIRNKTPPLIIVPRQCHIEDWYTGSIKGDKTICLSGSGYINDKLALNSYATLFDILESVQTYQICLGDS